MLGLAAALASGCTHYVAAPLRPEAFQPAFDARRLPERPGGAPWMGAELLGAALDRSPAVAEAAARYAAASRAIRVARNPPDMVLTLTAEYADSAYPFGPAAALDLPIDRGGRRDARIAQAELQALQALYDWREAAWTVRTALARARADLAGADAEVSLADAAVALRRERVERLRLRVAAGEDARSQQLVVAADLLSAQRRADEARGRRGAARLALAQALGLPASAVADLRLGPPLEPASLAELPRWRAQASQERRDVLRALVDYDLAENALRLEVARQYPAVHVSPGAYWDHGVFKAPFNAVLTLPPRDGNRAAIAQTEAARTAAARAVETAQAGVLGAVDGAAGALQVAEAVRARVRDADLPAARRMETDAERKLRAGEGDRVEELGTRAALADTQVTLADADRARRTALVALEDALHRAFDPAEAAVLDARLAVPPGP